MVLRVGLSARAPRNLVAEDDFAVGYRGAFAVAGAEIETDTEALEMPAEGGRGLALLRRVVIRGGADLHGMAVDAIAHES